MRLTKTIKSHLANKLCLKLEAKRTKVVTTKDNLSEEVDYQERLLGDKIWESKYGKFPFKSVPEEVLNKERALRVSVEGSIKYLHMSEPRPCKYNLVVIVENKDWEKVATKYLEIKEYNEKVKDELRELRLKINKVLTGINTSKQLENEWPEAFELLPAQDKGTDLICVTDIKDINRKLGIL